MRRPWALILLALFGCRASDNKSVSPSPSSTSTAPVAIAAADATSASADAGASSAVVALPQVETDWCLPPFRGLDEATCYWLPESFEAGKEGRRLLIYLSGIVPPTPKVSPQKENVQRIVSSAAKRANAAVLLPRGRRGIGPADAKDWWAWPTSASDYGVHGKAIVLEWKAARAKLEEAALGGRRFDRVYLAGSSSGAYFLSALALAGALTEDSINIDGFAATSGGSPGMLGASGTSATAPKRPFYVGFATGDPTNGGPKSLASFLSAKGWPVRSKEHAGGHGAREEYLDDAFQFWSESASTDRAR